MISLSDNISEYQQFGPKALGGGALYGDRLVRLIFIDEAGISNPKHEPYVTVAGVIVHGDQQLRDVEEYLESLAVKHVPEPQREGFVFHAKEIFNGGKQIDRKDPYWSKERRFSLAMDIASIPVKFNLPVAVAFMGRDEIDLEKAFEGSLTTRDSTIALLTISYLYCAVFVESYMKKETDGENCIMIMEDNQDARTRIKSIQKYNQSNPEFVETLDPKLRELLPLQRIRQDPLFQTKRPSSVLEVADMCAYLFKRHLMDKNDERYKPYFQRIIPKLVSV